jgi:hypothetical protein
LLLTLGFAATSSRFLQAAPLSSTPDCSATGGGWGCYLSGILHFLSIIAIVLGIILVLVIALAVKSYLKTKDHEKLDS